VIAVAFKIRIIGGVMGDGDGVSERVIAHHKHARDENAL